MKRFLQVQALALAVLLLLSGLLLALHHRQPNSSRRSQA